MLTVSFIFAVICFVILLLFFSRVPNIRTCELPSTRQSDDEPDQKPFRLAVLLIMFVYALSSFWNLGSLQSPQTFVPMNERAAIVTLSEESVPDRLILFPGVGQGNYNIEYSDDTEGWFPLTTFSQDHVAVLKWQFIPLELSRPVRYIRIHCTDGTPWLGELMIQDASGQALNLETSIAELSDESYCVPERSTYYNSSYFDEIYHVRTAWEHLHGIWPYEISHPPLGKEFLSLGILLFGMTPFGWRFSGTVTGVLMLPALYLLLIRLFKNARVSLLGTVLFAAGFMHYAQTRIATVDSYAVLFIILMYYFMLGWLQNHSLRDLAFSGIAFGFGAACKWTSLYAGAGLGVLWLGHWFVEAWNKSQILKKSFFQNVLFCVLFFVILPGLIYYFSYLPYGIAKNSGVFSRDYVKLVLDNQQFMFQYHANIVAEHPYSSRWYQWILNIRPILYYLEYLPEGKRISIAAFVNPAICWGGLISLLVLSASMLVRHDRTAAFILVAYLSGVLPWVFISRLTFEYHYFAASVFLIPAICYVFCMIEKNTFRGKRYTVMFTIFSVLLFILYFPVLNGIPVNNDLTSRILAWLPSWPI